MYIRRTDAHFRLAAWQGAAGQNPDKKATVVSPQIACSECRSTTEANGEERWLRAEWASGGERMAFIKLLRGEAWLRVREAPQKWSIDLGVFLKLYVGTKRWVMATRSTTTTSADVKYAGTLFFYFFLLKVKHHLKFKK